MELSDGDSLSNVGRVGMRPPMRLECKETESTCNARSIRIGIDLELKATGFESVMTRAGVDGMS